MANNWKIVSAEIAFDRMYIPSMVNGGKIKDLIRGLEKAESDLIQSLDMLQEELDWIDSIKTMLPEQVYQQRKDKLTAHLKQWSK